MCQCHRNPCGHEAENSADFADPESSTDESEEASEQASASARGRMCTLFAIPKRDGSKGWTLSRQVATEDISRILRWRDELWNENSARAMAWRADDDIMPFNLQKQVQNWHFQEWERDPSNRSIIEAKERLHRGCRHKVRRELQSLHRSYCKERYGGARVDAPPHRLRSLGRRHLAGGE